MAKPDFDQIARFCLNLTPGSGLAGTHLTTALLAEQLRQVWNARGAADLEAMEPIIDKLGDTMDPDNARRSVTRALRSLDAHPEDVRDKRGAALLAELQRHRRTEC